MILLTIEEYLKSKGKTIKTKKKSYKTSLINRTLLTVTIVLVLLITMNINKKTKTYLNKYVFETNYNFAKINTLYKKYILDLKKPIEEDKAVSAVENVEYYKEEAYKGGVKLEVQSEYNVKALGSGLVVFIGEKEDFGSSVVVQQSNGIDVTYGGVNAEDIKIYDYVNEGTHLGTANNVLYLLFEKDGVELDYKTYIK